MSNKSKIRRLRKLIKKNSGKSLLEAHQILEDTNQKNVSNPEKLQGARLVLDMAVVKKEFPNLGKRV